MKSVIYLLAQRYLYNRHQEHTISIMIFMTALSIFIGSFSLTLVTAIMNGFEYTVHEKMKTIHPSATIYADDPLNVDAIARLFAQEFPDVVAYSPMAVSHILINTPAHENAPPIVTLLKGIDPTKESMVSAIGTKLRDNNTLDRAVHDTSIAIGKELARTLGLSRGDTVSLFYIEQPDGMHKKVAFAEVDAQIGGIFDTGIDEYDNAVIYCSLPFFKTLFPEQGITQIGLALNAHVNNATISHQLHQRLQLAVHTWQELYPALFSALVLEKYAMFFILLLITLVASMNIIALIFMLISYKKRDIAIFSALGMHYRHVQYLFIGIGISITALATIVGIGAAWVTCILLEKYPFIHLPDVYYVSHLPARMTLSIAIIVFCAVLFIACIASWFATQRIKSINISHTLRFEG